VAAPAAASAGLGLPLAGSAQPPRARVTELSEEEMAEILGGGGASACSCRSARAAAAAAA